MNKLPYNPRLSLPRPLNAFLTFWPLILSGLVVLLAVLAFLQYHWTNEATAAAELRIGAELESLMMKWHGDLYGEFSAICTAMQVGPDSGARDTWNDYLERYVEWNNAAPHETFPTVYRNPDLVQNVYIWDTNLDSKPQLFLLNADAKKIESVDVPQNLQTLLSRLRAHSTSLSTSLRVWQLPHYQGHGSLLYGPVLPNPGIATTNTGWQFDENVPAIVHPIFQRDGRSLNSQSPVDWMVIVLDLNTLQKRILPQLATRYFGGLEGLDYKVAVVAAGVTPWLIYSSDSEFVAGDIAKSEASLNIFAPPDDAVHDHYQESKPRSLHSMDWHTFYGPAWFPVIEYKSHPTPWVLAVQHRGESLQEGINRVRQRNLAVSTLLMALLALNIALLTMAGIRAQKLNKLQMDFVASVSHELRTPLTAIFSAAENIRDGVVHDKSSLADYGSMVMGQSRHLMDYVDRILLYASIRSGKDRYNIVPLRVSEILAHVRKNMASLIIEESCVIEEAIDPNLPGVLADPLAVSSCLENLITNAIKYSGDERRIRITAALETTENAKQVAISIQDRGIGIHSSELKYIFEPFYRTPAATLAQIPGTGLGLSVCKHLAEAMGGQLSVKSEVGIGSTFTLHLRTADVQQPELAIAGSTAQGERA
ncbi:MAG TPA: HAMP domain-containing sensor histidine kinase [Candidatus Binatia bacterium]|nr:HAMP domain-containing sensor histidine kinase [Candidatus Binatia bacterium]